jgi:beta-xylosidase
LNAVKNLTQNGNFWFVPNLLLQKFAAPYFSATTKITFHPELDGEKAGLTVMGDEWAYISLMKMDGQLQLGLFQGAYVQCEDLTRQIVSIPFDDNHCYLRIDVDENGLCSFSYSKDNEDFIPLGADYEFQATKGRWIGAKVGIFNINPNIQESEGYAEFDWFRMEQEIRKNIEN